MNTTNPKDFMASPFLDTPATMEKNIRERQLQDDGENQKMNWNTKGTRKKKPKRSKFTPKVIREGISTRKPKKTPTKTKENGSVKRKENSSVKRKHASMENTHIPTVKRKLHYGDDREQDNLNETPVAMSGIQSSNDQCNDLKENSLLGKFVPIRKPRSQILRRKLCFRHDKEWLDSNGTRCLTSRGTMRNLADQRWFLPYLLFIHKKKRKKLVKEQTTCGWKGMSLLQNVSGAFTIAKREVSKFVKMPVEVEGEKHGKLVLDHNSVAADCHNFSTSTIEPSTPEKISKCSINQEDDICGLQVLNEAEKEIDRRLVLSHRSSSSGPIFYRRRVSTHTKINMDSNQPLIPEKVSGCRNNQENKICWHQDLEGKLGFNREDVNNKVVQANRSNSCYIVYRRKHSTPIKPSYQSNDTCIETPIRESESKCNNNWENEVQPQASECVFACKEKEKGDGFVQANSSDSSTFIEDCHKPISSENSMVFVQAEKTNNMPIQAHCPHSCSSQPLAFEKPLGCSNNRGNRSYGPQARIELLILKSRGKRHGRKRRAPSINSMAPISNNMVDVHRGRKITDLQIIPAHGSWSSSNNHKGSAFPSLESRKPILSNLDYIIHKLRHLNVNSVHGGDANHLENALVPFARGGTIVDVKSLFDLVKKKKLQAKVDLDPESNRMWELLMGNERADGETDENKEKWWEEERRVFYGRVDSFIAQMELILGDRQFSPWKGSVVDSVVGVFLTQNVSDHLSSSAFMSLAARFPLHSKGNKKTANVETMSRPIIVDESSSSSEPASCSDSHPPSQNSDEPITLSTLEDCAKMYSCCQREVCICVHPQDGKTTIYWQREIEVEHQVKRTFHAIETQIQKQTCDAQTCLNTENVNIEASLNSAEPESNLRSETCTSQKGSAKILNNTSEDKKANAESDKEAHDWDRLRREAFQNGAKKEQNNYTMDSLDYEAVRCADNSEVAFAIRERGQNNNLAMRIKDFLNRIVKDHGSIDLEWLRDVPPERAKDFLLSIDGLGIKSVECVRLLSLHHQAFPVDTNVGRICVRLGWVPLQPLPDSLQLHLLEMYPIQETVQKYIWPRLCKLAHETLYKLHYLLIAFGKVFCTKSKPNCNACPMRGGCKHFASAFASTRLGLPRPEETSSASAAIPNQNPTILPVLEGSTISQYQPTPRNCEPIIELPASPEPTEEFASPELDRKETVETDIEDFLRDDPDGIPAIYLNTEEFNQNILNYIQETNMELQEGDRSKALVSLTPEVASIPMPKLKNVSRLRTTHQVYELEDSSPLLEGLEKRDPDDHSPYLLAIWTPGETAQSTEPPKACYNSQDGKMCDNNMCFSCNNMREAQAGTVRGTLLIPCRTANRGSFPLNGTYFQVNEVFADHYTSHNPINVPRNWIWSLRRSTVFFGTSVSAMLKGLTTEEVQRCFWRGYVCVRAFDRETRNAKPLCPRFHSSTTMTAKIKGQNQQRRRRSTPVQQKKAKGMNMDDKQTN